MASSHCFENPPALEAASGGGVVVDDFGGQKAYITGSAGSKAAVVLISDAFGDLSCPEHPSPASKFLCFYLLALKSVLFLGFEAPKLRKIADKVASSGYFVVVPDFLHGDPYDPSNPNNPGMWMQAHNPKKGFEEAKPVIAALKEKGVSSVGAAGYCWGGIVAVELAKAHEIQAAVVLHPGPITVDDIKEVKCPISILGAENDHLSPPELVKQFEQVLSANSGVAHFVKIFPGVAHGWSVRYSDDDEDAVKSAEEALGDTIDWFNKNLK